MGYTGALCAILHIQINLILSQKFCLYVHKSLASGTNVHMDLANCTNTKR